MKLRNYLKSLYKSELLHFAYSYLPMSPIEEFKKTQLIDFIYDHVINKGELKNLLINNYDEDLHALKIDTSKVSKELLNLGGNLMPLNLRLCFDTLRKAQYTVNALYNGMPNGWRLNYCMYLEGATNNYQFFDENGVRHQFKSSINDSSIHYDVAGTGLILIVEGYLIEILLWRFLFYCISCFFSYNSIAI